MGTVTNLAFVIPSSYRELLLPKLTPLYLVLLFTFLWGQNFSFYDSTFRNDLRLYLGPDLDNSAILKFS